MIGSNVHPSPTAADGKPVDQSRYIKGQDRLDNVIQCAQCGFYVDLDKRSIGDSMGAIGDPTLSSETVTPPSPGVSETEYFGDPVDANAGCPFCNSMNPKGRLREKDFGTGKSVENL